MVVRDLFYKYKTFNVKASDNGLEGLPKKIVLISFYAELILFKLCLMTP
jgi:hypothetical protein